MSKQREPNENSPESSASQNQRGLPGLDETSASLAPSSGPSSTSLNVTDVTTDFGNGSSSGSTSSANLSGAPKVDPVLNRLVGGYRLNNLLGEGGMGRVYKASDAHGQSVAIKLLSPQWATSSDALQRFKQEGYIASQINHPHCVFVHRVDEDRGIPFIAMELMTGQTLKDLVAKRGALPFREAVQLILQCIDGLVEAHARGMIHRDIKPANCYLDDKGNVKIGDFGLARSLVEDSELTRTGAFLGTPLFASPEQVLGKKIDVQSDIYSLSSTLYYLLAGKAPFESPNAAQVIAKIASSDPPSLMEMGVSVPKRLEDIVMKGLARETSKRYESFQQMRAALLPFVKEGEQVASIKRRLVAMVIDSTAVSFMVAGIVISLLGPKATVAMSPIWSSLTGSVFSFFYFWPQEYFFGATLGKKLMRLKVVDKEIGGPIALHQSLIRTSSFLLLTNSLEALVYVFFPNPNPALIPFITWSGACIGYALSFSTWLKTSKSQLLHEWFSQTVTRVSNPSVSGESLQLAIPDWTAATHELKLAEIVGVQNRIGRFQLTGQLETDDGCDWYVAEDAALKRQIWILLRSRDSLGPSEERRQSVRRMRMRLIESGNLGDRIWDAYLAPIGVPLSLLSQRGTSLPWPIAKGVFRQLLEERSIEGTDRIPEDQWDATRFWIDSSGRLTFSDASVANIGTHAVGPVSLFKEVARLTLPTVHPLRKKEISGNPSRVPDLPVCQLVSYRGLKLLEKVARSGMDGQQFQLELAKLDSSNEQVTGSLRMANAAGIAILLLPLLFVSVVFLAINGLLIVNQLHQDTQNLVNLQAIANEPEKYAEILQSVPESEKARFLTPERKSVLNDAVEEMFQLTQRAYDNVGAMEKFTLGQAGLDAEVIRKRPSVQNIQARKRDEEGEVVNRRIRVAPSRGVEIQMDQEKSEDTKKPVSVDWDSLHDSLKDWESKQIFHRPQKFPAANLILFGIGAIVVWSTIFRGGLLQMFTGLAVMRRDGCRSGLLRCFWRALLLMSPFALLVYVIPIVEMNGIDGLWWASNLKRLFIALPIVYVIGAFLWPQVGPHDKLSYTAMVPR